MIIKVMVIILISFRLSFMRKIGILVYSVIHDKTINTSCYGPSSLQALFRGQRSCRVPSWLSG